MRNYIVKSVWGRRGKLAMTLAAIVLGVAFIAGSLLLTNSLRAQFADISKKRLPDLVVAATGSLDPERLDAATMAYSDAQIDHVRNLAGVQRVEGQSTTEITFEQADGTMAGAGPAGVTARGWTQFPLVSGEPAVKLNSGSEPGFDQVVVDSATLQRSGYHLGDRVDFTILVADEPVTMALTIGGTADWTAGSDGSSWIFFNADQLRQILGDQAYPQLWVQLASDASSAAVAAEIASALPGSQALTADEVANLQGSSQADQLSFLRPLLLVFAGVALAVACLLIVNTFSILVVQRTRELALLQALGASPAQVRRAVLAEAVVTGLLGSILGVFAGWAIAAVALRVLGRGTASGAGSALQLSPAVVAVSLGLGMVVTVVAALFPARRASQVPPVVAMQGEPNTQRRRPAPSDPGRPPELSRPLTRLAALNAVRRPGRTMATAMTLTIGLGLVGLLGVLGTSMKATIADRMPDAMTADFVVMTSQPISEGQITRIANVSQVASVHRFELAGAQVNGVQTSVYGVAAADFGTAIRQTMVSGRAAERAGELVVTNQLATSRGWSLGDQLAGVVNGRDLTWTVVGTFDYPQNINMGEYFTAPVTLRDAGLTSAAGLLAINLVPDADAAQAKAALAPIVAELPGSTLLDVAEYNRLAGGQVDTILLGVNALIAVSVLIALLGIVNTMGLSVVERTRELGLLRAVGMTPGQIRGLVTREALLISVLGGGVGILGGVLAGVGLRALIADQMTALGIPWLQIGVVLVATVVIGLLAAAWPAQRAASTEILVAVAA